MKLVSIGCLGEKTVYVGLSMKTAIERYNEENPTYTVEKNNLPVKEMDVYDKFYVYDIWDIWKDNPFET